MANIFEPQHDEIGNPLKNTLYDPSWQATLEKVARQQMEKQPDNPAFRTQLGSALLMRGKADEAETEFRAALKVAPRYGPALLSMARISLARQKPDEAMGFVRLALDVNPKDIEANLVAAHVTLVQGRSSEAIRYYETVLQVNPNIVAANAGLADLRLASGQTVLAHVPSHHDHRIGEWIGIRPEVDHVVTFNRACTLRGTELCQMPCSRHRAGCDTPA